MNFKQYTQVINIAFCFMTFYMCVLLILKLELLFYGMAGEFIKNNQHDSQNG